MDRKRHLIAAVCIIASISPQARFSCDASWGFYAHRLINRLAVFTLPEQMIEFYKVNIDYITDHAVDPDKRRYAVKAEAMRHYIDLDQWIHSETDNLPRDFASALLQRSKFYLSIDGEALSLFRDSIQIALDPDTLWLSDSVLLMVCPARNYWTLMEFRICLYENLMPEYDPASWSVPVTRLGGPFASLTTHGVLVIDDRFCPHGILPYHLERCHRQLVHAFRAEDPVRILRLSAELGHYLGDAHVPLHTSKNYNGQLTGQDGIHAFWESRIPELFAADSFDYFVGPAYFLDDIRAAIWKIIFESHCGVEDILQTERTLRSVTPEDQQYCFEPRGGSLTMQACRNYAAAFNARLNGQVEQRMRSCILATGCFWMSAWVEAGQPDLLRLYDKKTSLGDTTKSTPPLAPSWHWLRQHE